MSAYYEDGNQWTRKCEMCGKEIEWHRRGDTKFCGQNCRKAYSRRKDKVKHGGDAAMSGLQELRLVIKKYADLRPDVIAQLNYLKGEINDLLHLAGDQDTMERVAMLNDMANRRGGNVTAAVVTDGDREV